MLSIEEALQCVWQYAQAKSPAVLAARQAVGLMLAEDVTSDIDSPPHDKSLVDGYALVADDVKTAGDSSSIPLIVNEQVAAGQVPTMPVGRGTATRIMTGAPLPQGADAVVMVEKTELDETEAKAQVRVFEPARAGQNIFRRGASLRYGETVLSEGHLLRALEVGVLAEVGRTHVRVIPRPTVAVLATGDELVPAGEKPGPAQIRNSNGPLLGAMAERSGAEALDLGTARDNVDSLSSAVQRGLESDVLALSGGVSAGALDLVPQVLRDLGVRKVFHKVAMKPGKPLWFGVHEQAGGRRCLVFGLPGNPVSSLVCFELFVRAALARLGGAAYPPQHEDWGVLGDDFRHRSDRPTYYPARLQPREGTTYVRPVAWQGSADLKALVFADGFAYFPAGDQHFRAGEEVRIRPIV